MKFEAPIISEEEIDPKTVNVTSLILFILKKNDFYPIIEKKGKWSITLKGYIKDIVDLLVDTFTDFFKYEIMTKSQLFLTSISEKTNDYFMWTFEDKEEVHLDPEEYQKVLILIREFLTYLQIFQREEEKEETHIFTFGFRIPKPLVIPNKDDRVSLRSIYYQKYLDQKETDFTIQCQKKVFKVHKILFWTLKSEYFSTLLTTTMKEGKSSILNLKEEDPNLIYYLVEYLYRGKNGFIQEYHDKEIPLTEIIQLAKKFLIPGLSNAILEIIDINQVYYDSEVVDVLKQISLVYPEDQRVKELLGTLSGIDYREALEKYVSGLPQFKNKKFSIGSNSYTRRFVIIISPIEIYHGLIDLEFFKIPGSGIGIDDEIHHGDTAQYYLNNNTLIEYTPEKYIPYKVNHIPFTDEYKLENDDDMDLLYKRYYDAFSSLKLGDREYYDNGGLDEYIAESKNYYSYVFLNIFGSLIYDNYKDKYYYYHSSKYPQIQFLVKKDTKDLIYHLKEKINNVEVNHFLNNSELAIFNLKQYQLFAPLIDLIKIKDKKIQLKEILTEGDYPLFKFELNDKFYLFFNIKGKFVPVITSYFEYIRIDSSFNVEIINLHTKYPKLLKQYNLPVLSSGEYETMIHFKDQINIDPKKISEIEIDDKYNLITIYLKDKSHNDRTIYYYYTEGKVYKYYPPEAKKTPEKIRNQIKLIREGKDPIKGKLNKKKLPSSSDDSSSEDEKPRKPIPKKTVSKKKLPSSSDSD